MSGELDYKEIVIDGKIGEGSFAHVFKGDLWGETVAVKQLKPTADEDDLEDFEHEIELLRRLRHPNIVEVVGTTHDAEGNLGMVSPFYSKGSLEHFIQSRWEEGKRMSLGLAINITSQVARGLNWIHNHQIIHRDLKTANIFIDHTYTVKIGDFGLAYSKQHEPKITGHYGDVGTPAYMAPEVLNGEAYGYQCDIFSLGMILAECVTGYYPFKKDGKAPPNKATNDFGDDIAAGDRPQIPRDCPLAVAKLIRACWQDEPAKRPSLTEISKQLAKIRADIVARLPGRGSCKGLDQAPEEVIETFEEKQKEIAQLKADIKKQNRVVKKLSRDLEAERASHAREVEAITAKLCVACVGMGEAAGSGAGAGAGDAVISPQTRSGKTRSSKGGIGEDKRRTPQTRVRSRGKTSGGRRGLVGQRAETKEAEPEPQAELEPEPDVVETVESSDGESFGWEQFAQDISDSEAEDETETADEDADADSDDDGRDADEDERTEGTEETDDESGEADADTDPETDALEPESASSPRLTRAARRSLEHVNVAAGAGPSPPANVVAVARAGAGPVTPRQARARARARRGQHSPAPRTSSLGKLVFSPAAGVAPMGQPSAAQPAAGQPRKLRRTRRARSEGVVDKENLPPAGSAVQDTRVSPRVKPLHQTNARKRPSREPETDKSGQLALPVRSPGRERKRPKSTGGCSVSLAAAAHIHGTRAQDRKLRPRGLSARN